jgi:hypothetical protein
LTGFSSISKGWYGHELSIYAWSFSMEPGVLFCALCIDAYISFYSLKWRKVHIAKLEHFDYVFVLWKGHFETNLTLVVDHYCVHHFAICKIQLQYF